MGGSKQLDVPSNIIAMCARMNGEMESNPHAAEAARNNGWKLRRGQDPENTPVWYPRDDGWFYLDNAFNRVPDMIGELA